VSKIGRNDKCWCDSNKKYKKCCFENDRQIGEQNNGWTPYQNILFDEMKKTLSPEVIKHIETNPDILMTEEENTFFLDMLEGNQ
jgi:hypothetical protein